MNPLILLGLTVAFAIGFVGRAILDVLAAKWSEFRIAAEYAVIPADDSLTCQGPHRWINANAVQDDGEEHESTTICTACGLIPKTNMMLPAVLLVKMAEAIRIDAKEDESAAEFAEAEEKDIKEIFSKEIESGLDVKKLFSLHQSGQNAKTRFELYKAEKNARTSEGKR